MFPISRRAALKSLGLLTLALLGGCSRTPNFKNRLPNIVVVMTDDQRWDTLWAMPYFKNQLSKKAVVFTNAYVTTPVCTPCRASILSGGFYAHNTGVLTNTELNGTMEKFRDEDSLSTTLQKKGYKTGFVGKYIHGYKPGYIPPGWTKFVANNDGGMLEDWFNLKDITVGSSGEKSATGKIITRVDRTYLTDFQKDQAIQFIEQHQDSPFFLLLSTYAPHGPSLPAPEDREKFNSFTFEPHPENDVSDKPLWLRKASEYNAFPWKQWKKEEVYLKLRDYLRSLVAVDRALEEIVGKVSGLNLTASTAFFFTSDNGVLWGEHQIYDKGNPYEEAVKVPFAAVLPGIKPKKEDRLVSMNLDLGATIFNLAGITRKTDGMNLLPVMVGKPRAWRKELLLEAYGYLEYWNWRYEFLARGLGLWAGLRVQDETGNWKYVEHPTGEGELYNLDSDPHEKENQFGNPSLKNIVDSLSERLRPKKGLLITTPFARAGKVNSPFYSRLTAWGGKPPYTWSVQHGSLPDGFSLNPKTGEIRGYPRKTGITPVIIQVSDSSTATHALTAQTFRQRVKFYIV